jgi:hypothetical protein
MAKSADAADLKSAGRKAVGVQVPLWAPTQSIIEMMSTIARRAFCLLGAIFSVLQSACEVTRVQDVPADPVALNDNALAMAVRYRSQLPNLACSH